MVKVALHIKADLTNLKSIEPMDRSYQWHFKVDDHSLHSLTPSLKFRCNQCGELTPNWVTLNQTETFPAKNNRGFHLVMKCRFCQRECTSSFDQAGWTPYSMNGQFQKIVVLDCRGIEPMEFEPRGGWKAIADSDVTFPDIDLSEKEWVDYDEQSQQEVSVMEWEVKFTKE